jgi:hypothetical protein
MVENPRKSGQVKLVMIGDGVCLLPHRSSLFLMSFQMSLRGQAGMVSTTAVESLLLSLIIG